MCVSQYNFKSVSTFPSCDNTWFEFPIRYQTGNVEIAVHDI